MGIYKAEREPVISSAWNKASIKLREGKESRIKIIINPITFELLIQVRVLGDFARTHWHVNM